MYMEGYIMLNFDVEDSLSLSVSGNLNIVQLF
jgi:hypothetical protein